MRRALYLALRSFSTLDHWLRQRLTHAGWLVLGVGGAAAAAGMDLNRTATSQGFAFLATLLALAYLASRRFRARIEARRELPRYATVGERYAYRIAVTNRGAAMLDGATLSEDFPDPRPAFDQWRAAREPGEERRNWFDRQVGYFRWRWLIERRVPRTDGEVALPALAPGATRILRLGFTPRQRGRIALSGIRLGRTDPFGLVRGIARQALPAHVIALPRRYRLPPLAFPGHRAYQPGGVSLAARYGDSEEFLELRDYRPGDPLQRVHWKSFARTGKPIVKEFQDEFFERHALVLDTGSAAGETAAFEEAVAVAASFVQTIDTQECLLDLLFVGDGEAVRGFTAGRGQLQAEHMLEVLAGVQASPPEDFAALAREARVRCAGLASLIVVLLGWDELRRSFVTALRNSGVEVRVLLVCARTDAPAAPATGVVLLHPGEIESGLARRQ